MNIKKNLIAGGIVFASIAPSYAQQSLSGDLLKAVPGECFAQVVTPAKFRVESSTVVVKEASERVRIVPAKYKIEEQKVLVSEASKEIVEIPASYRSREKTVVIDAGLNQWVLGSVKSNIPVNPLMLSQAKAGGADTDNATAGQCFHEHFSSAKYETVKEKVLISEAYEESTIVPAKYEWIEKRVMVSPEHTKLVQVPAKYKTVEDQIMVEPAKNVWKKGRGGVEKIDQLTGEVMCLVEVPPVYKKYSKTVVEIPASSRTVTVPAQYETIRVKKLVEPAKTITRQVPAAYRTVSKKQKVAEESFVWHPVNTKGHFGKRTGNVICKTATSPRTMEISQRILHTPASVKTVEIPAKYATKRVKVMTADAQEVRESIPAETRVVKRKVKVADASLRWAPVLCEINATAEKITEVQQSLKSAGYNPGPIDGLLGPDTMAAVSRYQNRNSLATGGLTFETLKSLGVTL